MFNCNYTIIVWVAIIVLGILSSSSFINAYRSLTNKLVKKITLITSYDHQHDDMDNIQQLTSSSAATTALLFNNNNSDSTTTTLSATTTTWNADGLDQDALMYKDECILVDENDTIIGHDSKYVCHQFNEKNPQGLLHRAFSVFLFNHDNELLLQKRANTKITFPNVWTNSCCSHPLYGYTPCEIDDKESIDRGHVIGIKYAAIRKLNHELGIDVSKINIDDMKYLTRLHYSAASTTDETSSSGVLRDPRGESFQWGESEIDYILFYKANFSIGIDIIPNVDEISEVRYVAMDGLKDMMTQGQVQSGSHITTTYASIDPTYQSTSTTRSPSTTDASTSSDSALLWSPWFRIIAEHGNLLPRWWGDLTRTLSTNEFTDYGTIYRIL